MENYYDILEVSQKASEEVIEKAYKVLAKKYHPDLQTPENKNQAEEKMKKINEAYSILSDQQKRAEYDEKLLESKEEYTKKYTQQNQTENIYTQQKGNQEELYRQQIERQIREEAYREQIEKQIREEAYKEQIEKQMRGQAYKQQAENQKYREKMEEEYNNAYYNYLRSLGYKIKEKWTWKKFLNFIKAIAIMATIAVILWFFPPTNKLMVSFYESNPILQAICNIIGKIVEAIWSTIYNLFTHPPKI